VPYNLPANKTRSLFKTLSSPGGGGYNELRIEDKKGEEQIYLHAQRDWDENIEHDQKIRVGHQRHDTVEANSYSEFQAEEQRTTHLDRKTEVRANDHLTVANTQHVKVGTGQFVETGNEIHYYAGANVVIDAGMELTASGGGSFLKLDPGGVTLSGATIKINSGGGPGKGSGIGILAAALPLIADQARTGSLLDRARKQEHYDEQVRFVTGKGSPINGVKTAIILPSESAPKLSKSDTDGRQPRIQTNSAENAEVHLIWDELVVPAGADDYEASRKK
jgi:type VI secretion system secreted protein VgrG